jgi:hypothetical protein
MTRRKQVYKITYPNGKIYVGMDLTGSLLDLWAAGYVLHCTDIEDGEVVVPTVDRLREIGDVLHDICDGLLEPDGADARPRR